ncbi:beta-defensin 130B-like [Pipistrellus kuhlii]|uniref:beta-defensin 130B-like n=1 Tax=Pipistrellus kuhlii TaxID=59472 RepID=UPI001E272415|nr:beta-defensin 130B-like [Pipistrellus kuhlii]
MTSYSHKEMCQGSYEMMPPKKAYGTTADWGKAARAGIVPGKKQCVLLRGICKKGGCTSTDDTIGVCNDEQRCCRRWWILFPYPTPAPKSKSP